MLEAKTKLSQLVEAVGRGEQVFLKRNVQTVAQIVPVPKANFPFGFLKKEAGSVPDALLFETSEEDSEDFGRL